MGRGDRKTAKGKRTIGSFGVSRPKKQSTYPATTATKKETVTAEVEPKKATAKKTATKKAKEETSTEA